MALTDKSLHMRTENKQLSSLAANIGPNILPSTQSCCSAELKLITNCSLSIICSPIRLVMHQLHLC